MHSLLENFNRNSTYITNTNYASCTECQLKTAEEINTSTLWGKEESN